MNYDEINLLIVGDLYIDESKASYIAMGYKRYLVKFLLTLLILQLTRVYIKKAYSKIVHLIRKILDQVK